METCPTCDGYGYLLLVRFLKPSSHECLVSPETMRGNESDRTHTDIPCPDCNVDREEEQMKKICEECGELAFWNSHFRAYMCRSNTCSWRGQNVNDEFMNHFYRNPLSAIRNLVERVIDEREGKCSRNAHGRSEP